MSVRAARKYVDGAHVVRAVQRSFLGWFVPREEQKHSQPCGSSKLLLLDPGEVREPVGTATRVGLVLLPHLHDTKAPTSRFGHKLLNSEAVVAATRIGLALPPHQQVPHTPLKQKKRKENSIKTKTKQTCSAPLVELNLPHEPDRKSAVRTSLAILEESCVLSI